MWTRTGAALAAAVVYPGDLSREELAEKAGYSPEESPFTNPRGGLRSLGLIECPSPGRVVALPVLFLD